jgi:hypothetical protein
MLVMIAITLASISVEEVSSIVSTEVALPKSDDQTIVNVIKYVNKGNRIVNDVCEMMEERVGYITGSDKPNCRFNVSFVIDNSVYLFDVNENVRSFILTRKKENCKQSSLECGELTIILKLIDLINSIVHISLKINNMSDLFHNIEAITFYELFEVYVSSLTNPEILANITLRKDLANSILDRERLRIKRINSMTHSEHLFEDINHYIGSPIKTGLCYVGTTIGSSIGSLFGSAIEGTAGSLSFSSENKMILIGLVSLFIIKR